MTDSTNSLARSSLANILIIRLVRRFESLKDLPQIHPEVDASISPLESPEYLSRSQKIDVIGRRARAILEKRSQTDGGISPDAIDLILERLKLLLAAGLLLLLIASFQIGRWWLLDTLSQVPTQTGGKGSPPTIGVEMFVSLTVLQFLCMLPPVFVLLTSRRSRGFAFRAQEAVSLVFSLVMVLPSLLVRWATPRLTRWLLGGAEPGVQTTAGVRDLTDLVRDLLNDKPRFVALTVAILSLTGWFVVCLGLFLCAFWKLGFVKYDYDWQSALWPAAERVQLVQRVGWPMQWLACVPNDKAVEWASDESRRAEPNRAEWEKERLSGITAEIHPRSALSLKQEWETHINKLKEQSEAHRACWSDFLIKLPLVYGLLPRSLLLVLNQA